MKPLRQHTPIHQRLIAALALCFVAVLGTDLGAQEKEEDQEKSKAKKEEKDPNTKTAIPKNAAVDCKVWGAVVYATAKPQKVEEEKDADARDKEKDKSKKAKPAKPPKGLADYAERLGKIKAFKKYKHFSITGQHTQKIFSEYTNWVVPSKELFLNVDSKGPADDGGINLHVQLWRRTKVLVKTDTTLKQGSPLIIAGPKWRDGQLIFLLMLKE